MGDFTIKLHGKIENETSPELRSSVNGLAAANIKRLLKLANSTEPNCLMPGAEPSFYSDQESDNVLLRRNLVAETNGAKADKPPTYTQCYYVAATPLGLEAQQFVVELVLSALSAKNKA